MRSVTMLDVGRIVFVGGLLAILAAGLWWSFNPGEEGGVVLSGPESTPSPEATATDPGEGESDIDPGATADPSPEPEPEPEPEPTGPTPEDLIAAAPEPSETTVQVLDAGGGGGRAQAAAEALGQLGYQVVNVTSARASVSSTTIWFNDEAAALAMRARDERLVEIAPNEALSTGVDVHVLVGPDWPS